jgi:nitrogenase molybdenum-iron protein alpha/beta subunit
MSLEFRPPFQMSYQIGVLVAANAIRDAYLVVDGPNCTMFRASHLQGNHDWNSDLLRADGYHRVADTDATTERLAAGDERLLKERLGQVITRSDCGLVLLSAMSPAAITGRQYDRQVRELRAASDRPVAFVPSGSLIAGWLAGYAAVLEALVEALPWPGGVGLEEDRVAVVGHLMHRNEADLQADVTELGRLLRGLGLTPAGCWLDGGSLAGLLEVARAGTVVSLPYGRAAARGLARRTGARLVECALPLGLDGCRRFLEQVAVATGREQSLERLLDGEFRRSAGRMKWLLPNALLGKRIALVGDPHATSALAHALAELGCQVPLVVYWAESSTVEPGERDVPGRLVIDPDPEQLGQAFEVELRGAGLDLVVTHAHALSYLAHSLVHQRVPFLEWGFPAYHTHALVEAANLGFQGTLRLVERVANALGQQAVISANQREPR